MSLINPNSDEYRFFLNWCADEKSLNAKEIIDIAFEGYKYEYLQQEYLKTIKGEIK